MNKLHFKHRESRTKGQTVKGLSLSALSLFFFLFLISFTSAESMGYGKEITTTSSVNYSLVNVNNSQYLQGYTPSTLGTYLQSLMGWITNSVSTLTNYYSKTDINNFNASYLNTTNMSYVPYTGANQNVNLGNNNLTVNGTTLFVDTNNSRVGIGTTTLSGTSAAGASQTLKVLSDTSNILVDSNSATGYSFFEMDNNANKYLVFGLYGSSHAGSSLFGVGRQSSVYMFATTNLTIGTLGVTNPLTLGVNGAASMTLINGGNIGIGTTNPFQKLHVNGSILANGTINATGGFGVNGKSGITGNYTILKDVDLVGLTKTYCFFNITGGLITGSSC